jgi:hypothetical protein
MAVLCMPSSKRALLLFLSALIIVQSLAQVRRPGYSTGIRRRSQPWRKSPYQQRRRSSPSSTTTTSAEATRRQYAPDYSSHFLDYDDWITDKRSRLWQVDLKSRTQGASWTTKLTIFTIGIHALQMWNPSVTQLGIKLSDRILRGEQLYRLITPVFLQYVQTSLNSLKIRSDHTGIRAL